MKTLIANQKWLVITLLTVLIVSVGIQNVSYGQTLNVGEPRTVRLFYFLPNDRPYRQEVVDDMKTGILEVQSFFSEQMAAHGHGNKTFQIETDDQGDPIVHRVNGDHGDSHYRLIGAPGNEISRSFDNSSTVQLVVMDISRLGGLAIGIAKQSGIALVHGGWDWRTAAHELGHAFGLHHDFRDNAYMMSYSSNRNSLSTCAADFLVVNPYFNSNIPMEDQPSPTIELLSTRNYMEGAESIPIRLRVTDLDGLHQVFLYVYDEHILSPDANAPQVKACRLLSGETDTIVEFSYDGELPSDDGRNLSNTVKHKIGYGAVDMKGNANLLSSFYIAKISPQHITTFEANRGRVHSVDFSPDDTTLAFAHEDGSIVLWDMTTEAVITTIQAYIESAMVASFSPDGTLLASSSFRDYSGVKLWNTVTHENVGTLTGHRGFARNISFSPDGTMLAFGSDDTTRSGSDRTVRLWDVATHTNIATIEGHTSRINSVAFSPDGTTLASISSDRTLKLWDVATHTNIATLEDAGLWAISFSPDGAILALPADSTSIKLWDVATHTNIATLDKRWTDTGQRILSRVTRVVFSPDGSTLAAAQGTEIRLWDVASRTHIATFTGHTSGINSVAYSHDGTILASASSDRTVKLWDTSEWAGTPVVNHPPTGAVTISGTAAVSETLTADASAVTDPDGPPTLEFSYQWLADLLPIVGATFKTYTLTENEVGKKIRVRASYIDGLGAPVNVSSGATAEIVSVLGAGQAEILPVSQRTSQVRHAIVAAVPGINFAADVTTAHLAMIKTLSLSNQSITSLKEGDFAGLSSLTELRLGRNQLSSLPVGVFDGLSALTQLWLYSNQLSSLPVGVFDGLSALTDLNLYSNQLSSLPVGVFDGLSALTRLILHQNQLSSLPVGVFDGLSALTDLNLQSRVVARIPLTVSLEKVADGQFKAVAPTGAPFDIVLPINVPNGSISGGATTITIPTGSVESEVLTVTRTPGTTGTVAAYIGTLPGLPTDHQGYALVKSADLPLVFPELGGSVFVPVRERPPAVRDAIVNAVPNVNSAADVTEAHLAAITELNLRYKGITSLKSSDFDGLTALATLNLSHNDLSSLPDSVFDGLTALASLSLYSNDLTTLPLGIFDDLTALTSLSLYNNDLTTLPSDIFDDLTALTSLSLYNNDLTTLPLGIFDDLTALTSLSLYSNDLTTLPSGIFDDLTALTSLRLDWNDLTTLPEGVFDRLTVLTTVNLSRNTVDPLPLTVSLQKVGEGQLKAVAPAGAPFELVLPLTVTNGSINGGATSVTIPAGSVESEVLTVTRTPDTTGAVTVNIGTLPSLPSNHRGYALVKSADLPLYALPEIRTLIGSRTPQVRDAIVTAVPGVNSAADVTEAHLAAISSLNLSNKSITSLKTGDFDGLSGLTRLVLEDNRLTTLPSDIFDGLTALTWLDLGPNQLTSLPSDIFDGLTALTYIDLNINNLTTLPVDIFEGLTSLNTISLAGSGLTSLPARIFDGLGRPAPALMWIGLSGNNLTTLPDGIFEGLISLTHIYLYDNPVDPLPLTVSLQKVADGQFKAVAPAGAPFDIVLPLTVTNGYIRGGTTSITLSTGSVESDTFTVTRTAGTTANVTVNIGTLPSPPRNHFGYSLVKSADLPLYALPEIRILIANRTPQVRDAIVAAVPGVDNAADVTEAHLAAITELNLRNKGITSLKSGDFDGLTSLTRLMLMENRLSSLPVGIFDKLTTLTSLNLGWNKFSSLPVGIFDELTALTSLSLYYNQISSLQAGIFDELAALIHLYLEGNQLRSIPSGIFDRLTALHTLRLSSNPGSPFSLTVSLEKVADGQFKAVAPTGAPLDIVLPIRVSNGSINGATTVTIPVGSIESEVLTVTRASGATFAASADIVTLPSLPNYHTGYTLIKSADLPLTFPELGGRVLTPVSERTPQVRDAIVAAVPGVNSAADVTEAHLAALTNIRSLNNRGITSLKSGDFDGLTTLTGVGLIGNDLTTLPAGIFEGLTALTHIHLNANDLTTLPAGIFEGLTALKMINLAANDLTTLPAGIFEGLTALTSLGLFNNRFSSLPDGLFEGLTSLTGLSIYNNSVDPLSLTVSLEKVADDQFKAVAPTGAPFAIVLPISVTNGSITGGTTTTTIPAGSVESEVLTVTRAPDTTGAVTVNIGTLPSLPSNHRGYALVKSANLPLSYALPEVRSLIGSRTPQVRDAIVRAVPGVNNADDVTEAHLAAITSLWLAGRGIATLKTGDFDGLTSLKWLNLGVNKLMSLPADVFSELSSLTTLDLAENRLTSLPANVFSGLSSLTTLELYSNQLTSLPANVFNGLSSLTTLELSGNQLTSLPADVFSGLSSVTEINLGSNRLTSLPADVFSGLSSLTKLVLSSTAVNPLPLTVSLEKVGTGQFKAVAPTGAPFDLILPLTVTKGSITSGAESITIPIGSVESGVFTVTRTPGTTFIVTVDIGTLPDLPFDHHGYALIKSADLPLTFPELGGRVLTPVSERTPQVRDAIVRAVPGVNNAADVTETHLAAITSLYLGRFTNITTLKAGDFDGLTGLTSLDLSENQLSTLPEGIFDDLTALTQLELHDNQLSTLPADIFDTLTKLRELQLHNNQLSTLPAGTFNGLSWLDELFLQGNQLTTLPAGIFDKPTGLRILNLEGNQLSTLPAGIFNKLTKLNSLTLADNRLTTLPAGIFEGPSALWDLWLDGNRFSTLPVGIFKSKSLASGFSSLRKLYLEDNTVNPLPLTLSLEKVANGQFKAVAPAGATFDFALQISVANGTINGGATTLTIPKGSVESETFTVTRTAGTTDAVTVNISYPLPELPTSHQGYALRKSADLPLEIISASAPQEIAVNIPDPNLRAKIESALGKTAEDPITATEMAMLTSLNAQDSSISDLTGLETATRLITLKLGNNTVSDISALVDLTNLTELHLWDNQITNLSVLSGLTDLIKLYLWGNSISDISHLSGLTNLRQLRIGENSISNISAVARLTNLTYLSLKENAISNISALARLTNLTELQIGNNTITDIDAVKNLTKLVWLDMPNNRISDISAVQNLTSLRELYFQNNAVSDLSPLVANTGFGEYTELDASGNPLSYPSIYTHIPALQAKNVYIGFDNRVATTPVKISGDTQSGNTGTTLAQPFVVEVRDGSRVVFAGVPVTFAVTAGGGRLSTTNTTTDTNGRAESTLTLGNTAGANTVRVSVAGITQTTTFTATATTTNTAPVFTDGTSTTRRIAENTAAGISIGTAIAATDADNDALTYTLSGADAAAFSIDNNTGQLRAKSALDYETKHTYTVIVTVSDGNLTDAITITINVTDIPEVRLTARFEALPASHDGSTFTFELHFSEQITISYKNVRDDVLDVTGGTVKSAGRLEQGSNRGWKITIEPESNAAVSIVLLPTEDCDAVGAVCTADRRPLSNELRVIVPGPDIPEDPGTVSPIINHTPQVRDAIVAALPGINSVNDVTEAHLATITSLNLRNKGISTLNAGDLDGLTALTELRLQGNQLRTLPANIFADMSSLKTLDLGNNQLTSLSPEVFSGLTAVTDLHIHNNQLATLPQNLFSGMSSLTQINIHSNRLTSIHEDAFSGLPSLTQLFLRNNRLTSLPQDVFSGLSKLQYLYLDGNQLTDLPTDVFSGLSSLIQLLLNGNQLSTLPTGAFRGLTGLTLLQLQANSVAPMPLTVSLEKVGVNQFKATAPAGAPFAIILPVRVANGSISGGATTLTIPQGAVESAALTVRRTLGTTRAVTVDIGTFPGLPAQHQGYELVKSTDLPLTIFSAPSNSAPVFTDGTSTIRTIAENTAAGINIGTAITATDAENSTLTYTLNGPDAGSFDLHSTTGQLKTKAALDYETKASYTGTITVSDGSLTDTITVTLNITDINELPTPTAICRVGDILAPGESCTYPDTDAVFSVLDNGDSKWNIPNYPWLDKISADGSMSVTVTVNDENYHFVAKSVVDNSWEIEEIGDDTPQQPDTPEQPIDTTGTPTLSASTAALLTEATLHEGIVTLTLSGRKFARSIYDIRDAVSVSGITGVTVGEYYHIKRQSDTEVTVEITFDGNLTTDGTLTITVDADAIVGYNEAFTVQLPVTAVEETITASTEAPLTEATLNGSTVTLTLSGRIYAASDSIGSAVSVSGIPGVTIKPPETDCGFLGFFCSTTYYARRVSDTEVKVTLEFEGDIDTDGPLTFTVGADAIAGYNGPALTAQVSVSANPDEPVEPETPEQPEDIGVTPTLSFTTAAPLTEATLHEGIVTLTLNGGTYEQSSRRIRNAVSVSGITGIAFDSSDTERISDTQATIKLEFDGNINTDSTLTITLEAGAIADYNGAALTAQIPVTAVSESVTASTAAALTEATLDESIVTLTLSGRKFEGRNSTIRRAVSVTGITGVTVGTFDIDRESDTEVTVELTFNGNLNTDGTLTFTVGPGAIAGYNGPAFTAQVAVSASEAPVEIVDPPRDAPQDDTPPSTDTRTTFEATTPPGYTRVTLTDTGSVWGIPTQYTTDSNVGAVAYMVLAKLTDCNFADAEVDRRSIVYIKRQSLGQFNSFASETVCGKTSSTWSSPWDAVRITHLRFYDETSLPNIKEAVYNATTGQIEIPGVWQQPPDDTTTNTAPVFTDGASTRRTIPENTAAGINIGTAIAATDADNDALTYTLSGTDAVVFSINSNTGQLRTKSALDYETKHAYTVKITVSDGNLTDTITVTINVTDIEETIVGTTAAPLVNPGDSNTELVISFEDTFEAFETKAYEIELRRKTPPEDWRHGCDTIRNNESSAGTATASFGIRDLEPGTTYQVRYRDTNQAFCPPSAANNNPNSWSAIGEGKTSGQRPQTNTAPAFADGATTTRTIAENTTAGASIGTAIAATDADNDALTYTLGGTDAATFNIVSTTGQLKIKKTLDYETKRTYTVKITVSDGSLTDTITVTINVTDINEEVGDDGEQQPEDKDTPEQPDNTGGTPTLRVSTAAPLTEATLHGGIVTLNLSGGTFESSSFRIRNAVSVSGITGVTVESFGGERISDTQATIELEYDGNMTVNGTLTISVGAGAIKDYNGATLTAQIPVTANTESVVASTNAALTEVTLDESVVTLTLSGAKYASSIFDIRDAVSVSGINGVTKPWHQPERKSDTELTVKLEFDGTDFDSTSTLTFTVNADAIAGYNGPALTTQISVTAVTELVVASTPAPLKEATLDGSTVTLTLSGAKYAGSIWDIRDGVTVSGITGVTMPWNQPDRKSDTQITIELEFDGNMNTDGTLTFTVGADAIENYNGSALTAQVTVTADRENALLANFPNPFNPETWIPYQLAKPAEVTITIYAIDGQVVRQLVLGHQTEGMYQSRSRAAYWDGKNEFGEPVASGVYFYRLTAGGFSATRKMLIRK